MINGYDNLTKLYRYFNISCQERRSEIRSKIIELQPLWWMDSSDDFDPILQEMLRGSYMLKLPEQKSNNNNSANNDDSDVNIKDG